MSREKQLTFAMIKPDAVKAKLTGKIIDIIEHNGFTIFCLQKGSLDEEVARDFYDVHSKKPFFNQLIEFITSGSVVVMALMKENAIADWRKLMGATDPAKAEPGTIRKLFGTSIDQNAVHGSDSEETAYEELLLFFPELEHMEEECESEECKFDEEEDEDDEDEEDEEDEDYEEEDEE